MTDNDYKIGESADELRLRSIEARLDDLETTMDSMVENITAILTHLKGLISENPHRIIVPR